VPEVQSIGILFSLVDTEVLRYGVYTYHRGFRGRCGGFSISNVVLTAEQIDNVMRLLATSCLFKGQWFDV
jgi:hypothetical protein